MDKRYVLDKLHQLPVIPLVVREVMDSFRDPNSGSSSMAAKIVKDQGLSAKVLRMANSSFYGLSREVGSIQDAVTVLGFETIRSMVVSAGFTKAFPVLAESSFDRHAYWTRSFKVASYTEALSNCMGGVRQLSFTSGLFHDVGQLVLSVCIPEKFTELLEMHQKAGGDLLELEREHWGFDHAEIGAEMAKRWNFPRGIEHAIRYWRYPAREPFELITGLVHVAVMIEKGLEGAELLSALPVPLNNHLQLNWEKVQPCLPLPDQLESATRLMLES